MDRYGNFNNLPIKITRMFPVASSTALMATFFTDNGTLIYYTFGVLLTALAALLGLGFAIRHVKKWITGRKA